MKLRYILLLPSLVCFTPVHTLQELDDLPEQAPNLKPQVIIHSVANILAQIGSIIGNPHNKPNVGQNVAGILGNIVNIALIASHRGLKTEREIMDYLINELHLDQEIRRIIEHEAEEIRRAIALEA